MYAFHCFKMGTTVIIFYPVNKTKTDPSYCVSNNSVVPVCMLAGRVCQKPGDRQGLVPVARWQVRRSSVPRHLSVLLLLDGNFFLERK